MSSTACVERSGAVAAAPSRLSSEILENRLRGEAPRNPQPSWIYDAVRATVHAARGTAKVIADALSCKENHVTDLADPTRRVPMKVHEIVPMTLSTNCYAVLDALERQVGRVAFPVISESAAGDAMQQALAREVTAFGEFLAETAQDLADGRIDSSELKRLLPSIDSIIARTCEYRAMVVAKARDDARQGSAR